MSITNLISDHQKMIEDLHALTPDIQKIANILINAVQHDRSIFWMGNGGSAADAQHLAAELIGRFKKERRAIRSIALTTDTSILTALANDYSFEKIFARQLEGLCQKEDVVIGISTSGNSQNVIEGFEMAKSKGATALAFTGCNGGKLKTLADATLVVPSDVTARIQEAHILVGHILCQMIEEEL